MSKEIYISQSFIKSLYEYKRGDLCGLQFKAQYIDGIEFPSSDAMKLGQWFEYMCTGQTTKFGHIPEADRLKPKKATKKEIEAAEKKVLAMAVDLSTRRRKSSVDLRKKIMNLLRHLGMEKADFAIKFSEADLGPLGKDEVEFYISTNPGEELKPLRKIASGGEISRITLCLKTLLSDVDKIPTVIFDEVDIGIGGRIAEAVGDMLAKVSKKHQILCITHLPQIPAFADNHLLVKKEVKGDATYSGVTRLHAETRKLEIARMLGGKDITTKTVEHADEILKKRKRA